VWKPKIYIGTSIFDMIFSQREELKRCSILFLEKCINQKEYEGFVSAFTLFELNERHDIEKVIHYVKKYDLKFIAYRYPKEIDYLAANYLQKPFLSEELKIEYYHISSCAYLNLEFYVCWNINKVINFPVFRSILHSHIPRGYGSNIQLETPEYFIADECSESSNQIIQKSIPSKVRIATEIESEPIGKRSEFVQSIVNRLISDSFPRTILPNEKISPARIPILEADNIELEFEVTSFEQEIKSKSIPLLDLDYEDTGFGMDYHLFKLNVIKGAELLKKKQLELIYYLPTKYTEEEFKEIISERNKKFIDWILPQLRNAIDASNNEFAEIPKGSIQRYSYKEIDYRLSTSIWGVSIKKIKEKSLELTLLITQNAWQFYQGFMFENSWCKHNNGFDHGENTHLIIEKEGKEIWIVMINTIIP
jgi:hypothetical protein